MSENTSINETLEAFAKIVIEKWERKVMSLGIGKSSDLINSFHHHVHLEANGSPKLIGFTFNYYGKFVDMGVGKGVKSGEWQGTNRNPKAWYSSIFFGQVKALGHIMAEKYAMEATQIIVENSAD